MSDSENAKNKAAETQNYSADIVETLWFFIGGVVGMAVAFGLAWDTGWHSALWGVAGGVIGVFGVFILMVIFDHLKQVLMFMGLIDLLLLAVLLVKMIFF